jgi:hypothetical protein
MKNDPTLALPVNGEGTFPPLTGGYMGVDIVNHLTSQENELLPQMVFDSYCRGEKVYLRRFCLTPQAPLGEAVFCEGPVWLLQEGPWWGSRRRGESGAHPAGGRLGWMGKVDACKAGK